jgi:hypothetical protein
MLCSLPLHLDTSLLPSTLSSYAHVGRSILVRQPREPLGTVWHAAVMLPWNNDRMGFDAGDSSSHESIADVILEAVPCDPTTPLQVVANGAIEVFEVRHVACSWIVLVRLDLGFALLDDEAARRLHLPMNVRTLRLLEAFVVWAAESCIGAHMIGVLYQLLANSQRES